jgi:hypothetical protein
MAAVPQGLSLGSQPHAARTMNPGRGATRRIAIGLLPGRDAARHAPVSPTHRVIRILKNGQISCYETHNRFDDTLTTGLDGLFSYAA